MAPENVQGSAPPWVVDTGSAGGAAAGRVLRGEAGVRLLAALVPGVEVLPHGGEAALVLGPRPHPAAGGGDGRQAGLARVGADAAGAGRRGLGGVLRHGAAVDGDVLGFAVVAALVLARVPAEPDDDGHDAGHGQDDGQTATEAPAAAEVAGPAPGSRTLA